MDSSANQAQHNKGRDKPHIRALGHTAAAIPCTFHTKAGLSPRRLVIDGTPLYGSPEHTDIGEGIKLTWSDGKQYKATASEVELKLTNGARMTYGKLNSLAGDFYATYDPICLGADEAAQLNRFKKAFNLLDVNTKTPAEIAKIEETEQKYELGPLNTAPKNEKPSKVYSEMDEKAMTRAWFKDTNDREGEGYDAEYPSYIGILLKNFDHFGTDAEIAYNIGHKWALTVAGSAKKDPAQLAYAYRINAFADHFLQDRFSAGHLRTPRRQLHNRSYDPKKWEEGFELPIEDWCANLMHNEDSAIGLTVTSPKTVRKIIGYKAQWVKTPWTCVGDDYLLDDAGRDTFIQVHAAVQASANEVYTAWNTENPNLHSSPSQYEAWQYAPTLASANSPDQQLAPLFRVNPTSGKLERRGTWFWDITDRKDYKHYTDDFDPILTAGYAAYSGKWDYPISL